MSKLVKRMFSLLLALLVVLPANNKIYASPSDKIYSILERGSKNNGITNSLLLKALGKGSKKSVKLITDKNELKTEAKKVINDNSYILGLDISKWNGNIDWKAVKKADIDFVIIRAGYGTGYVDPYFKTNMENAIKNNLMIGIYWFSYSHTYQGAKLEAEKCYKTIKKYKDNITLPVFWDFEYDSVNYARKHGNSINKRPIRDNLRVYCYDSPIRLNHSRSNTVSTISSRRDSHLSSSLRLLQVIFVSIDIKFVQIEFFTINSEIVCTLPYHVMPFICTCAGPLCYPSMIFSKYFS